MTSLKKIKQQVPTFSRASLNASMNRKLHLIEVISTVEKKTEEKDKISPFTSIYSMTKTSVCPSSVAFLEASAAMAANSLASLALLRCS